MTLKDGGTISIEWISKYDQNLNQQFNISSESIAVLLHGLGGSSRSEYIYHLANKLFDSNYQVVAVNSRGCGGLPITTNTFVPRQTDDLRAVISEIKKERPHVKNIYLVGFSMGAAWTIKYLSEEGNKSPITAAVCVSPPWDMGKHTSVFYIWTYFVVVLLKAYIYEHKYKLTSTGVTLKEVLTASNMVDMDKLLIRSYGYSSIDEY